jgi:GT2 family glycosyltransferase
VNVELSVIIPTHNRAQVLLRVLEALQWQTIRRESFEVVVVDDGSEDNTQTAICQFQERAFGLRLECLSQENRGAAAARNSGLAASRGDLVVFLGDDTIPARNFLEQHLRFHERHGSARNLTVVGYTTWPPELKTTPFARYIGEQGPQFGYRHIKADRLLSYHYFYTSNVSLRRALLRKLDYPFDEDFPAAMWEDIELGYRLEQAGMRLMYNPRAVVYHHHSTTIPAFCQRQRFAGQSSRIFLRKHPELVRLLRSTHTWRRIALLAPAVGCLIPIADCLDRALNVPLPSFFYQLMLQTAYAEGAADKPFRLRKGCPWRPVSRR